MSHRSSATLSTVAGLGSPQDWGAGPTHRRESAQWREEDGAESGLEEVQ
jgi:hypothetical protein